MKQKKSKKLSFGFVLWMLYVVSVNGLMAYLWLRKPSACLICGQGTCGSPVECLVWKLIWIACFVAIGVLALSWDSRKKKD